MAIEDEQGIYRLADAPGKPHPHCYCYLTAADIPTLEELEQALADGEFDTPDNKFSQDPSFNTRLRPPSEALLPTGKRFDDADWSSGDLPDNIGRSPAAKSYVSEGYQDMNALLRNGSVYGATPAQMKKIQNHIDSLTTDLLKGSIDKDLAVYRGMKSNGFGRALGMDLGFAGKPTMDQLQEFVGSVFVDKGFMSTWAPGGTMPTDTHFTGKAEVVFRINLPSGTKGSKLTIGDRDENEFLLSPGSEMVISSIRQEDGRFLVDMTLTGQRGVQ